MKKLPVPGQMFDLSFEPVFVSDEVFRIGGNLETKNDKLKSRLHVCESTL